MCEDGFKQEWAVVGGEVNMLTCVVYAQLNMQPIFYLLLQCWFVCILFFSLIKFSKSFLFLRYMFLDLYFLDLNSVSSLTTLILNFNLTPNCKWFLELFDYALYELFL